MWVTRNGPMTNMQVNLYKTMPEKFDEINARFNAATIDEVIPHFKGEDPRSQEV